MHLDILSLFSGGGAPLLAAVNETCVIHDQLIPCGQFDQLIVSLGLAFFLFSIAMIVIIIIGTWKVFQKAGKPGWASIIPIYNIIVLLEIIGYSPILVLLMFVPVVNGVFAIIMHYKLAQVFNRGIGFALGLIILPYIFLPILGFGDSKYIGITADAKL
jgi:hypothetical protein